MTNEMAERVFLVGHPYWAGSNEVQNMLPGAKHGSFIFFPELSFATWFCKGSVTIILPLGTDRDKYLILLGK